VQFEVVQGRRASRRRTSQHRPDRREFQTNPAAAGFFFGERSARTTHRLNSRLRSGAAARSAETQRRTPLPTTISEGCEIFRPPRQAGREREGARHPPPGGRTGGCHAVESRRSARPLRSAADTTKAHAQRAYREGARATPKAPRTPEAITFVRSSPARSPSN